MRPILAGYSLAPSFRRGETLARAGSGSPPSGRSQRVMLNGSGPPQDLADSRLGQVFAKLDVSGYLVAGQVLAAERQQIVADTAMSAFDPKRTS